MFNDPNEEAFEGFHVATALGITKERAEELHETLKEVLEDCTDKTKYTLDQKRVIGRLGELCDTIEPREGMYIGGLLEKCTNCLSLRMKIKKLMDDEGRIKLN